MAKTIYRWDSDGYLTTTDVVADDYVLMSNETTTGPDKIEKSTVKRNGNGWRQLTEEEDAAYVKAHQTMMPMPNSHPQADPALLALGQQVGNLVAKNQALEAQLQKSNEATQALGQLVAPLIAKENATTQGGN